MSAIDAVAEVGGGPDAGEFAAPRGSRRLAGVALVYVTVVSALAFARAVAPGALARMGEQAAVELVLPVSTFVVAVFGWLVRRGRLRVDPGGVRWGFELVGWRMPADHIARVRIFEDAVAVERRQWGRAFTWYLSARDWVPWDAVAAAFARCGGGGAYPVDRQARRAPLGARLQGYGLALDLILVVNAVAATFVMLLNG